jgi:uncharacterized protein YqgC (DUF456 family)
MIVGLAFFSFLGMFIGGLVGAVGGELYAGKTRDEALRAGWGVFVGNVFAVGLKLAYSGVVLFFFVKEMV